MRYCKSIGAALWIAVAACSAPSGNEEPGPGPGPGPTGEAKPPVITDVYQSNTHAYPGEVVTFEIAASDPQGSALTFSWSATAGSLKELPVDANRSRVEWTVPSCGNAPSVTVVVTNAHEQTTSTTFGFPPLPTCAWQPTGPLHTARTGITATRLPSDKVLVTGGYTTRTEVEPLSSTELYDPVTRAWSDAASMSVARYAHTATLLASGKVLVTGGTAGSSSPSAWATTEVYDPAANTWSAGPSMDGPRYEHTATLLASGKVLVVAGIGRSTAEEYDPAANTWSSAGALAASRYMHTATLLPSGKVLVAGGIVNDTATSAVELYDPASHSWSAAAPMAAPRYGHSALLLPSGKLLVTGGSGPAALASAELYDPATNTWSSVAPMLQPHTEHAAVLLSMGKVLVAGGRNGLPMSFTELYDPATNAWASADFMRWARDSPLAVGLSSGQVLVVGGYTGHDVDFAINAELYVP